MEKIAYIVPLCHRELRSNTKGEETASRINAINNFLYNFISKQTKMEIEIIFIEQILKEQKYYLNKIRDFKSDNISVKQLCVSYPVFNKCWLYNIAANNTTADHILFAEGDVYSPNDCFYNLIKFVKDHHLSWCFAWDKIYYTSEKERILLLKNNDININPKDYKVPACGRREGGIVYINKEIFNSIGGYNEWIEELGGPDNDIAHRLYYSTSQYQKFNNVIIHLWHTRDVDKYKPTRKRNVQIMKRTFNCTKTVTDFLISKQKGQIKQPLCAIEPFINIPKSSFIRKPQQHIVRYRRALSTKIISNKISHRAEILATERRIKQRRIRNLKETQRKERERLFKSIHG